METSSVDNELLVWLSKNRFLCIHYPKISFFLFKDGADLWMESFSCKQSFSHFFHLVRMASPFDVEVDLLFFNFPT